MIEFEFWHWLALAALLLSVEIFAPSTFFLGPAAAAAIIGVILLAFPELDIMVQGFVFSLLAVALTWVIRRYVKDHLKPTDRPWLNRRSNALIGRTARVVNRLDNGFGELKFDDTTWRVRTADGKPAEPGILMEVVGSDRATLIVERREG